MNTSTPVRLIIRATTARAPTPARYLASPFPTRASLSGKHSKTYTRFHVPIPRECWEEILASLVEMRTSWHRQTPSVPLFADPAVISCHYHQKQISFMRAWKGKKKRGDVSFSPRHVIFLVSSLPSVGFLWSLPPSCVGGSKKKSTRNRLMRDERM